MCIRGMHSTAVFCREWLKVHSASAPLCAIPVLFEDIRVGRKAQRRFSIAPKKVTETNCMTRQSVYRRHARLGITKLSRALYKTMEHTNWIRTFIAILWTVIENIGDVNTPNPQLA